METPKIHLSGKGGVSDCVRVQGCCLCSASLSPAAPFPFPASNWLPSSRLVRESEPPPTPRLGPEQTASVHRGELSGLDLACPRAGGKRYA